MGVDGVILPLRRGVGVTPAVVRASAGASEHLSIAQHNLAQAIKLLKELHRFLRHDDERRALVFWIGLISYQAIFGQRIVDLLHALVDYVGVERVVVGSDYPFGMGSERPAEIVRGLGLHPDDESKILGGNAARLLGLVD